MTMPQIRPAPATAQESRSVCPACTDLYDGTQDEHDKVCAINGAITGSRPHG